MLPWPVREAQSQVELKFANGGSNFKFKFKLINISIYVKN